MIKSVLIVKTSAIGDVIQTFPVLEYLREKFPEAKIDWLVEMSSAGLVRSHPAVSEVIVADTKRWRKNILMHRREIRSFINKLRETKYDYVFDLQGNAKSGLITAIAKAEEKVGFGFHTVAERLNLLATDRRIDVPFTTARQQNLRLVQTVFNDESTFSSAKPALRLSEKDEDIVHAIPLEDRPCILVAFGSKWQNKRLKDETLKEFLALIEKDCNPFYVFLHSNPEEKNLAEELHGQFSRSLPLGGLSLPMVRALIDRMDNVIAVDSAVLHLSGMSRTPTFSIFGPSSAVAYRPDGGQHSSYQGACPYGKSFIKRCPILRTCATASCIRDVSAGDLFTSWKSGQSRYAFLPDQSPHES